MANKQNSTDLLDEEKIIKVSGTLPVNENLLKNKSTEVDLIFNQMFCQENESEDETSFFHEAQSEAINREFEELLSEVF